MKARLQPLYFTEANERERGEFAEQMKTLQKIYGNEAEFLKPLSVGSEIPRDADAVLFPQLIGAAFRNRETIRRLSVPLIILTSRFGTVEMWDWEIVAYFREDLGLTVFAPYEIELAKVILRSISAKKAMRSGVNFLMFQDSPGEGEQAYIFKRFYWWEKECTRRIEEAFGVHIIYRSWKKLNDRAAGISDEEAEELWKSRPVPCEGVPPDHILKAVKIYMAVKEAVDGIGNVGGVGSNCLNESFLSRSTPCLAWDWMYEYDHILWACEGDTVTLISKYIFHSGLRLPMMMTNIYPFLVGMAALAHERISEFPEIEDPDNHALGVHCGYFGFAPQSFCSEWTMRPKVLGIVNDDAVVIDCRMKKGPVTMAKLHPNMKKITVIEAELEDYVQYPGSDCRNGALLRYRNGDGHRVMESLSSHHALIISGDVAYRIAELARVYGFECEVI